MGCNLIAVRYTFMDLIQLPEFIYKYISWDKEYHKRILKENEIFFSSVNNFK